jgi:acyl-CoA thioester hydrolase
MKSFTPYTHTVSYYETDKMGVVHHSNYIRWFEDARLHFLDCAGYPYTEMEADGIMIPVHSVTCSYKNAVRFGDTIQINLKIASFNGFRFKIEYTVTSADNGGTGKAGTLHAVGGSEHFFTDMNLKPVRTEKKYPKIFEVFAEQIGKDL